MKSKQLQLFPKLKPQFGGSLLIGVRKSKRPLSTKFPIHVVIKSGQAKGRLSFVAHQQRILSLMNSLAKKHNIRIFDKAVNFDHLHLVIMLPSLASYSPWIREFTAKIVAYLQTKTTQSLSKFFELRPFTRIASWGKGFKIVLHYQVLNQLEVVGQRPAKAARSRVKNEVSRQIIDCLRPDHLRKPTALALDTELANARALPANPQPKDPPKNQRRTQAPRIRNESRKATQLSANPTTQ